MTQLLEYIKMAFSNILSNKIRSVLTMIGIIIGIASVILVISLGNGAKNMITEQLNLVGSGQVAIMATDMNNPITEDDAIAIKETLAGVDAYNMPITMDGTAITDKGEFSLYLYGNNAEGYRFESNQILSSGRYYNEDDYNNARNVCYISEFDAIKLFGNTDVLGMPISVESQGRYITFTIVGLVKNKDDSSMVSFSYENSPIYINCPATTVTYNILGANYGESLETQNITVLLNDSVDTKDTCNQIINLLESRHNCKGEDLFMIQSFADIMKSIRLVINIITLFISFVAALSLIVGGVGVMNIMLVSVTERTREIGIRKALGAKTGSIMLQFLAESAILTMIGGIMGIILGLVGAFLISYIIGLVNPDYSFTPDINFFVIFGTTLFSSAVGIFFGIYPAHKAAKLNPIEALRQL